MAILTVTIYGWAGGWLRQLPHFWFAAFIVLLGGQLDARAQADVSKEYQIKAVFLFNFTQFVNWPPSDFINTNQSFCIGVLGDDPFGSFLDETVQGEKVNGHPLIIQHYHNVADIKNCQLLFISRSESKQLDQTLATLKGKSVLTVSDMDDFAQNGGIIGFVTEEDKIHFRINLDAAKNANLTISSQLLQLAEIVKPGEN